MTFIMPTAFNAMDDEDRKKLLSTLPEGSAPVSSNTLDPNIQSYLDLFKQTLPKEPEIDKGKEKRLSIVGGVNALGQALKQVVDFIGASKHGAPVYKVNDPTALNAFNELNKMRQQQIERGDRHNLVMTNVLQNAVRYGLQDKMRKDEMDFRTNERIAAQDFRSNERKAEHEYRADELEASQEFTRERDKTLQGYRQNELSTMNANRMAQLDKAHENQMKEISATYNAKAANDLAKALADIEGDNVPVVDPATGKSLIIPKSIYYDIAQKIALNPESELDKELIAVLGPDPIQNKQVLNTFIAARWHKFYKAETDAAGNTVFIPLTGAGSTNSGGSLIPKVNTTPTGDEEDEYWFNQSGAGTGTK